MKRRTRLAAGLAILLLAVGAGTATATSTDTVYADSPRSQRQIRYGDNRPYIDGDFYWESSRTREWLHSTSANPAYTNRGTVTRRTRGFLSDFTSSERHQIAVTRRRTPIDNYHLAWPAASGGLASNEHRGLIRTHGVDGLVRMQPFSLRYQGHPSTKGDPMANNANGVTNRANGVYENDEWLTTVVNDKVFIPTVWELQRYVESRGWSMARGNTNGAGNTDTGYWLGGTQTYTTHTSRGVYIDHRGRVQYSHMRGNNRGIVPMLHLKPGAAAGSGKNIGDTLTFGRYNSDNPEGHSGPITWRVVNIHNGYKLLMAEHAVDHFSYNVAPGGNTNNGVFTRSNHVNNGNHDIDIVSNLRFANTNANGVHINGAPEQPWFEVVNKDEFYRRNDSGARFSIRGRDVSGRSIRRMWLGGNFVNGAFNRGDESISDAGPIWYRLSKNDPGGRDTVITLQNDRNIFMSGHLPFNMIDDEIRLETTYDLPYNGYADNNRHVDVDVGLSNWNVNQTIGSVREKITGNGSMGWFRPPTHTTYAGTRYRMRGRVRVTDWGGLKNALSASQWNSTGLTHRTHSTVLSQPRHVRDMYLTDNSYNLPGDSTPSNAHGYDGSLGPVDHPLFVTWRQLRDAGGAGWVNFDTVMPIPRRWLDHGQTLGYRAIPNITTNGHEWPTLEFQNWSFELLDNEQFLLDWLELPNGNRVNNPTVGGMYTHRITDSGNYLFRARDARGYTWDASAHIRIDRTAPTGVAAQNSIVPTNGNVVIRLDSRDDETGLSSVQHVSGGNVQSQSVPSINQNNYVQTHRSFFTVSENGTYTFRLRDRVGNTRTVTHTVNNIDRTPPSVTVSQTPTGWTNRDVTVSWNAQADGPSDLRRVRFHDGNEWSSWLTASGREETFTQTVSSNRTVRVQVEDVAGNVATHTHTVRNIDKDNPALTVSHQPSTWTNRDVVSTFNAQDFGDADRIAGVSRLRLRETNGSWGEWLHYGSETELSDQWYAQAQTITSNGEYEVQVEDRAGNRRSRVFTVDWIDRTGPEVTSRLSPASWTNQNVDIIISGEDVNHEGTRISGVDRIRMRRAGSSSWIETKAITDSTEDSPSFADRSFTVMVNGVYEFEVRDRAGNTTTLRQTVNRIDRTPPRANGSFTPEGWTNQDITITWIGERMGNPSSPLRRYRVHDGESWQSWESAPNPDRITVTQTVSANGTYRFQVQDEAGNIAETSVEVTQYDNVAPVGNIRAHYDRIEKEDINGSSEEVTMIDGHRVTVDVFDVEDLGISGVEFVDIEEQRRMGSIHSVEGSALNEWQTVETTRYDWPDPYDVSEQTYEIDVTDALDTRFVLVVQDRAGNRSEHAVSNDVRHSVLQFKDFRITNIVNPSLSQSEVDDLKNTDLTMGTVPVTAGTNVTFDLTYALRHLDDVERIDGTVYIRLVDPDENRIVHTSEIPMTDDEIGHNNNRTITRTFRVPEGAELGFAIAIDGSLTAELANGTEHTITYPNTDSVGSIDNHLEEFFRFRIVQ